MANAPDVEYIWLSLPDVSEDRIIHPDHDIAVVRCETNAIFPRDLMCTATRNKSAIEKMVINVKFNWPKLFQAFSVKFTVIFFMSVFRCFIQSFHISVLSQNIYF